MVVVVHVGGRGASNCACLVADFLVVLWWWWGWLSLRDYGAVLLRFGVGAVCGWERYKGLGVCGGDSFWS